MKLTIGKTELEEALKVVTPAIHTAGPGLSAFFVVRITPDGDGFDAEILGSSGRVFAGSPLECEKIEPGAGDAMPFTFTLEGKRLKMWLDAIGDAAQIKVHFDGAVVHLSAGKGKRAKFPTKDPTGFPFWDQVLGQTRLTAKLKASRLSSILAYAKEFVSDHESKFPQLCVAEFRNGCLFATDKQAASAIFPVGMGDSQMRLHNKDFPGILAFLKLLAAEDVEILESDRAVIFRRDDGALFGESRFSTPLPDLTIIRDTPDVHWVDLSKSEVLSGVALLRPSVRAGDTRVFFDVKEGEGVVEMSMQAEAGGTVETEITCFDISIDSKIPLPTFSLAYPSLQKVLAFSEEDKIRLGVNPQQTKAGAGWVALRADRDGDHYFTLLAWLQ